VIVVRVDGDVQAADRAVREVEGVSSTDVHDDEITIAVDDGAALVSKVAVALDGDGVAVRDLTLRSPSLDDVFLELTGGRFRADDEPTGEEDAR